MAKKKKCNKTSKWDHHAQEDRVSLKVTKMEKRIGNEETGEVNSKAKKIMSGYDRSIHLSHDSREKKKESKLRLHISKTNREIDILRNRLSRWDEVEEQTTHQKQTELEHKKRSDIHSSDHVQAKKKRKGPETWKLRGAARPAHEVYDFDVRYVDPHLQAFEEATAKAKRVINAFVLCKGSFGKEFGDGGKNRVSNLLATTCRSFLSVSLRLALLSLEAKKFKTARERLLEIIELEGDETLTPITNARCRLMRMYLEANRPDSARRLWEKLPSTYNSVWIRYSAALIEFVSWKILKEPGSTEKSASTLLNQAIRSNVFCAYYISFHETFDKVMEYTEDVEDANDGTLEQAVEYCNSEQMGSWIGTEGAIDWIRSKLNEGERKLSRTNENDLIQKDLNWEEVLESQHNTCGTDGNDNNGKYENEETSDQTDSKMFGGMFQVGMEILTDAGKIY